MPSTTNYILIMTKKTKISRFWDRTLLYFISKVPLLLTNCWLSVSHWLVLNCTSLFLFFFISLGQWRPFCCPQHIPLKIPLGILFSVAMPSLLSSVPPVPLSCTCRGKQRATGNAMAYHNLLQGIPNENVWDWYVLLGSKKINKQDKLFQYRNR